MKTLWFAFMLIVLVPAGSDAEVREVSVNATDGFTLKGTYYSAVKGGPGILLLHQCNADSQIYAQLATMLNTAGYNVLAIDFRGFGGSKAGAYTDFTAQRQRITQGMPGDVDAALNFLASQPTVNPRALGIVAGGCGVNPAVQAARRRPEIRTLVLLSGGTDGDGETYVKSSAKLPILGVASEEDTDAVQAIKKLVALSPSPHSRLEVFQAAGHAASMFAKEADLEAEIVIWFRSNLPIGGYGLPPAIK